MGFSASSSVPSFPASGSADQSVAGSQTLSSVAVSVPNTPSTSSRPVQMSAESSQRLMRAFDSLHGSAEPLRIDQVPQTPASAPPLALSEWSSRKLLRDFASLNPSDASEPLVIDQTPRTPVAASERPIMLSDFTSQKLLRDFSSLGSSEPLVIDQVAQTPSTVNRTRFLSRSSSQRLLRDFSMESQTTNSSPRVLFSPEAFDGPEVPDPADPYGLMSPPSMFRGQYAPFREEWKSSPSAEAAKWGGYVDYVPDSDSDGVGDLAREFDEEESEPVVVEEAESEPIELPPDISFGSGTAEGTADYGDLSTIDRFYGQDDGHDTDDEERELLSRLGVKGYETSTSPGESTFSKEDEASSEAQSVAGPADMLSMPFLAKDAVREMQTLPLAETKLFDYDEKIITMNTATPAKGSSPIKGEEKSYADILISTNVGCSTPARAVPDPQQPDLSPDKAISTPAINAAPSTSLAEADRMTESASLFDRPTSPDLQAYPASDLASMNDDAPMSALQQTFVPSIPSTTPSSPVRVETISHTPAEPSDSCVTGSEMLPSRDSHESLPSSPDFGEDEPLSEISAPSELASSSSTTSSQPPAPQHLTIEDLLRMNAETEASVTNDASAAPSLPESSSLRPESAQPPIKPISKSPSKLPIMRQPVVELKQPSPKQSQTPPKVQNLTPPKPRKEAILDQVRARLKTASKQISDLRPAQGSKALAKAQAVQERRPQLQVDTSPRRKPADSAPVNRASPTKPASPSRPKSPDKKPTVTFSPEAPTPTPTTLVDRERSPSQASFPEKSLRPADRSTATLIALDGIWPNEKERSDIVQAMR